MDMFKDLGGIAKGISIPGISPVDLLHFGNPFEKITATIDDFKASVKGLERFGFTVDQLEVGIVPPKIKAAVRGALSAVQTGELKSLTDAHASNALLTKLIEGLITLKRLTDGIKIADDTVSLELSLGLTIPSVVFKLGRKELLHTASSPDPA